MKSKLILSFAAFTLGAFVLVGCNAPGPEEETPPSTTVQAAVYEARLQELPLYTTAMGTVEPYKKARLSTRIMGQVLKVNVEEGDRVRSGQVLVQLDKQDITSRIEQARAMLASAQSQLENARTYFKRIERLYSKQSATKQALDDARTRFEAARAAVEAARNKVEESRANLKYSNIVAPFSGYITAKKVQSGDLASPGELLLTVEMHDSMKAVTTISEQEVGLISIGDTAWVESDVPGLGRRAARVLTVAAAGDPKTRRFRVELALKNEDGKLKSGMFARVYFRTGTIESLAVPQDAVLRRGQLTGLFILDEENRSRLRWIRLGRKSEQIVEVLSGLNPGDRVVASGVGLMREGQIVREVPL